MDSSFPDVGDELQLLLVVFPDGPNQFPNSQPAAVATGDASRQTDESDIATEAEPIVREANAGLIDLRVKPVSAFNVVIVPSTRFRPNSAPTTTPA